MSFAEMMVVGYIAKEPEEKYTTTAKKVLEFSIAHKNFKGDTEWFNCAIWGEKRIEALSWLKKGMGVMVRGELNITAKDDKVYRNLNVNEIQVIGGGQAQSADDGDIPF